MESTYLYYPSKKVFRVLSWGGFDKTPYKLLFTDEGELSFIVRKNRFLFFKKFFEIKIQSTAENISCIYVTQLYSRQTNQKLEKEVVSVILKIF